jgi:hypothetical protein
MNGQKVKKLSHLAHYQQFMFDSQSAQEEFALISFDTGT